MKASTTQQPNINDTQKKMLEDQGRSNPLVSTSLQGNQSNPVLERTTKPTERMHDWKLSITTSGKKGGISNHSENFQLEPTTIQEKI